MVRLWVFYGKCKRFFVNYSFGKCYSKYILRLLNIVRVDRIFFSDDGVRVSRKKFFIYFGWWYELEKLKWLKG